MGHIRSNLINANPKFKLCGIVDKDLEAAQKLANIYRVSERMASFLLSVSVTS